MNVSPRAGRTCRQSALHRGGKKATEEELEAVTEVVLLVVAEVVAELAVVIGDLETRVAAVESR